jgi:hypothetical protein
MEVSAEKFDPDLRRASGPASGCKCEISVAASGFLLFVAQLRVCIEGKHCGQERHLARSTTH